MIVAHAVLLAAISSLFAAAPALAADRHRSQAGSQPCDGDNAFDTSAVPVAFSRDFSYFPEDQQAAPDDEQAAPDDGNEADDDVDQGADGGDDDSNPDGCADIMVAPYDLLIHPDEHQPMPVLWRREHEVPRRLMLT